MEIIKTHYQENELNATANYKNRGGLTMMYKIKITPVEPNAQLIMFLRKTTHQSMSDIKRICQMGDSLYECDSDDTQGLVTINKMNEKITELGFQTQLFIDDLEVDVETFKNIENRNIEIDSEFGIRI